MSSLVPKRIYRPAALLLGWLLGSFQPGGTQETAQEFAAAPAAAKGAAEGKAVLLPPVDTPPCNACDACGGFDFKKVPPVRIFPRPGDFPIPPSGPGYYSLLDQLTGTCREKPPRYGYPAFGLMAPGIYEADFRYLDDPKNKDHDPFDVLHRIRLGDNWMFSTGGTAWYRHMNEVNSRLSGQDNNFGLYRARIYGDLWFQDRFRLFVEGVYADIGNNNLNPLPIDINRGDFQNLFIDVKVADIKDHPAYVRIGRQEILLGSQRLISPLDWANTRRIFQGVRGFRQGEKFDVDLFWLQPVPINRNHLDNPDNNQNLVGLWTTYRPQKGTFLDMYYLFLDNTNRTATQGIQIAPTNVHTMGTRYAGNKNQFLYDVELMFQLGERGGQNLVAGAGTGGVGYNFAKLPLNPTFWAYYDYASGDDSPNGGGNYSTFNQLFPFGHYYLGWIDLVGRQNIHDINAHLFLYPTNWVTVWLQYHHFRLDSGKDALYSLTGSALRRDPTGASGNHVGDEIDVIVNFHLGKHSDILIGYSKLFQGRFLQNTGNGPSPELFFMQYNVRW